MSKSPEVTVITITRNRAQLLSRAIKSVLNQSYKLFNYIIVDGASTDDTQNIVKYFKDERIIYIQQKENLHPVISIDQAVNLTQSKYITFLDDDDEYLPTKIEKQLDLMETLSEDYGLVYCWMDYFDDTNNKLVREHHPSNRGNIFYHCIEKQSMGGTPTLFIRRKVYQEVNGWNKNLKYIADWEFNTRIARKYLVDYVPEVLVKVHINHNYERQMISQAKYSSKIRLINQIDFHNHFLAEFREGFEKYPLKKSEHLKNLAKLNARLGLVRSSFSKIKEINQLGIKKAVIFKLALSCTSLLLRSIFTKYEE